MAIVVFLSLLGYTAVLLSGFRLHKLGKPYRTLLLTLHKLVPVAMLVYLALTLRLMAPLSLLAWIASLFAGFCFLLMIATGGWISAAKEPPQTVLVLHKILPYVTVLATGAALYVTSMHV
jgi:hypothetical protein